MSRERINGHKSHYSGAGGAASAGVAAAHFPLPVIGVPIQTKSLGGLDSLLSIVQMPGGVPVASVAIGGAKNAGLLAVQILAAGDKILLQKMMKFRKKMEKDVLVKNRKIKNNE
jgi:5-(carboxyamino)imidazole ribonucleotide mutase